MKTHKARWVKNSPTTWILKARVQDGGAVLARIEHKGVRFYVWTAGDTGGWNDSSYAAQRACRRAMREEGG